MTTTSPGNLPRTQPQGAQAVKAGWLGLAADVRRRFASLTPYFMLMGGSALLGLLKSLIFARVLGVEGFGYYSLVDIIVTYGIYAGSWGLLESLNREIPRLLGAGETARAHLLSRAAAGGFVLIAAAVCLAYLLVIRLLVPAGTALFVTFSLGGVLALVNLFFMYTMLLLQARRNTLMVGLAMLGKSVLVLGVGYVLAIRAGLAGAVIGETLGVAVIVIAALAKRMLPIPDFRSFRLLIPSFKLGLPMMVGNLTMNVGRHIDRIIILGALGVSLFAQYSFAGLVVLAASVAVNIAILYVTPRVSFGVGAGLDLAEYTRRIDRLVVGGLTGGILAFPLFFFATRFAVDVFPDFEPGVRLMRLLYVAAVLQICTLYQAVLVAGGDAGAIFRQAVVTTGLTSVGYLGAWAMRGSLVLYVAIFVAGWALRAGLLFAASHRTVRVPR